MRWVSNFFHAAQEKAARSLADLAREALPKLPRAADAVAHHRRIGAATEYRGSDLRTAPRILQDKTARHEAGVAAPAEFASYVGRDILRPIRGRVEANDPDRVLILPLE